MVCACSVSGRAISFLTEFLRFETEEPIVMSWGWRYENIYQTLALGLIVLSYYTRSAFSIHYVVVCLCMLIWV
jgi:VanZ family protein